MDLNGLKEIINGPSYNMDGKLALAFAQMTGRPETEVLGVLREFIGWTSSHIQGRGKYEYAVRQCCDSFVKWFEDHAAFNTDGDMISFLSSHHQACIYAVLVGNRMAETK